MFKVRSVVVAVAVLVAAVAVAFSGGGRAAQPDSLKPAAHLHAKVPPQIRAMLANVSARRIEHTVRTLVSFHNRNTLSTQTNPSFGIGAARDWLFRAFKEAAARSGGWMHTEEGPPWPDM
jgi:hypothetical protein